MTKGKAIIEARKILGNAGAIRMRGKDFYIGTDNGNFTLLASGRNWQEALQNARKAERAQ